MKHQQFESWILQNEDLSQEQHRELQDHLNGCSSCHALYQAVHQINHLFRTTPQHDPGPDFSVRWLKRVEKVEDRKNRLILLVTLGVISLATALLLTSIGTQLQSAAAGFPQMLLEMVTLVANWIVFINQMSDIVTPLFRVSIKLISPTWVYFLGFSLTGVIIAWIYALIKSRRLQKEVQS